MNSRGFERGRPVFLSRSPARYQAAVLLNGVVFAIAAFASQRLLGTYYRPLIQKNPRHLWMLRIWIVNYAFVGIQAGWTMRPFVGSPTVEILFFRDAPFSNAYVQVGKMLIDSLIRCVGAI